jgi:hypothetical protein
MMSKMMGLITSLFALLFQVLFFAAIGLKLVLHREVPDMLIGFLAWGAAACLVLEFKFRWDLGQVAAKTTTTA